MIYEHRKKRYAIGMKWAECENLSAAKGSIKSERKPYVMVVGTESGSNFDTTSIGTCSDDKIKGVTYSGAMAVGLIEPDTIICQKLADGRVWFAVVHAGVPFAGHDAIVDQETSDALLKDQITFTPNIIGDALGAKMALDEVLETLDIQVTDGRFTKDQLAAITIKQPPSFIRIVLQLGLVLALAAAGATAWWIWDTQLRSASARDAAFSRMTKTQEEEARIKAQIERTKAAYKAQVEAKKAVLELAQTGPLEQWQAWEAIRRSLPLTLNGYMPDTMECSAAKCTVTWKGDGPLVRFADKAAIPNWVEDQEPSTSATSEYLVPAIPIRHQTNQGADAVSLRLQVAQILQYSEGASVGAPQPVFVPAPPPQPDTGLKQADLGFTGDFRVGVGGNTSIIKVGQALGEVRDLPIALKSVRWTMLATREPSAQVEGYWAHQGAKP